MEELRKEEEVKEIQNENKVDTLEEIEKIMLEELRYYANDNYTNTAKSQRLNITDRMCKSANVVLATENLKERRFMNRTERKDLTRKIEKQNK